MSIGALDAANAYGRIFDTGPRPGSAAAAAPEAGGFGAMLGQLVTDTAHSLKTAETAGARQIAGKGDLVDVATAIGAAEVALDTMVAVRDRVVGAYSEIMRLQI